MSDYQDYGAQVGNAKDDDSDADSVAKEMASLAGPGPKMTYKLKTAEDLKQVDSTIADDLKLTAVDASDVATLKHCFDVVQKSFGKEGELPADQIKEVIKAAKYQWSKSQHERLQQFIRYDRNAAIGFNQMISIMNRCLNEKSGGSFMTVREMHELFNNADEDYSGYLNTTELKRVLQQAHLMVNEEVIEKYMAEHDSDQDGKMDFEEFMALSRALYKKSGGKMVANKRKGKFDKTRGVVDKLKERVQRNNLTIDHLKQRLQQLEMQAQTVSTVEQTSQVNIELEGARKEMKALQARKDAMQKSHRENVARVKRLGSKELAALKAKVVEIDRTDKQLRVHLDFVDKEYTQDFKDALVQGDAVEESLREVLEFANESIKNAQEDQDRCRKAARDASDMIKRYKIARKGTVYDPNLYNSAKKIHEYLQEKTAMLADWLLQRTKFTQEDRKRFLDRVDEARKKRAEYEANKIELNKHKVIVEKATKKNKKELDALTKENEKLRKVLNDPVDKVNDEAKCKELMDKIKDHEAKIMEGQKKRFQIAKQVFKEEHQMHLERAKTSLLQVELGELSLLLQDVEHDPLVEARYKEQQAAAAKKKKKPPL